MKTKYTKGTWQPKQFKNSVIVNSQDLTTQTIICQVYGDEDEARANIQLIAAAPELLDALQYLLNCNTKDRFKCELQDAINKAETAIKKAIGE